jgi:hypothetical protein
MFIRDLLIEAIILKLNKADNSLMMYLEDILLSVSVWTVSKISMLLDLVLKNV